MKRTVSASIEEVEWQERCRTGEREGAGGSRALRGQLNLKATENFKCTSSGRYNA